jgi:hypothetical protein
MAQLMFAQRKQILSLENTTKKQVTAPVAACLHRVHSFDTVQLID